MVSRPFRRFEAPPPVLEDELAALFAEAERRGVNIRAALALAASPEEVVANVRARLAAEARPEVQQVRENMRAPNGRSLGDFLRETFARPEPPPDAGLLDRLLPGFRQFATPRIPEGFVTGAPVPLQPAARVVRELSSDLGLATLPLGGSPRVIAGGLLGAAGGATAGQAIGGDVGEIAGAIGGGVAGGIPAVQRLAGRGATKLAQSSADLAAGMGRSNVGNVLLPRAPPQTLAARARGRPTIPVFVRATEIDRPAAQAFIDDLAARAGDRTGSVGLQNVVPEGLDDLGIQDLALKLRTADALGIRATSDGRPISFLLASRPSQFTTQQFRRGAAVTVDTAGPGQGRTTYIGFNIGARAAPAQSLPPPVAPTTAAPLQGRQVARAATDLPQSSADLEREIAAARARLPQSSAEAALLAQGGQRPPTSFGALIRNTITRELTDTESLTLLDKPIQDLDVTELRGVYLVGRGMSSSTSASIAADGNRIFNAVDDEIKRRGLQIRSVWRGDFPDTEIVPVTRVSTSGALPPQPPAGGVPQTAAALPQSSAEVAAARGGLPPRGPPVAGAAGAPPAVPPAGTIPPAAVPPSQPPLMPTRPSGIEETLKQAKAIVERDRPGITSRLMDYVPGLKQVRHGLQPALDMLETMTTGWVGQGLAKGKIETSRQQARIVQLERLDAVFGPKATATRDFKPAGVAFKGTAEQAKYPYVGTLADSMERPALYDMSTEQRAAIAATHNERSLAFGGTKADYGLDIGEHPVQPGGVHIPSVGVGEDDIEIAGSLENALRRGRAKTRIYETLADRWAHDNKFRPETNVSKLFAADDDTLATLAGRKVLVEGMGGKTRLQVIQETHPELAAKMDILQKKVGSLRATAARIGGQQAEAIDNFMQSPLDPADLATLQADLNPRVGANAVGRQGPNFGKDFKALKFEVAGVKAQIATLRPAWENANLKPYVFVEDGIYRYFPVKEAKQVKNLLKTSESKLLQIIDRLRATAFGGDFSPVTIQGVTAWFSDPIGVSRFIAQGKGGLSQASVLADMKANPASWRRFTAATGINPLGGVEKEFSTGYLSHPKLGKFGKGWKEWNEALYRPITKLQKDIFDNSYDAAIKHGLAGEQAAAVAADDATKIIPRSNFRRLGQSTRDAARYRAALTSVSFLTQPVALMNDATKGLVKIGTKKTLTRSEVFAVKRVLTLVAATEAIAITSNVYHAQTHNLDLDQAVKDSLNPNSGKFMSLVLPNGARIGLGGPFRSIIRMIAPREIEGSPVPVPFGGIERFAKGKMGPVARIAYDEIRNKDYYGKPIRTENFPVNILQGIEYALEGSAPLTVGSSAQQLRKGESVGTVAQEAASQFAGTNLQPDDPAYAASLLWKKDVQPYFDIPANAKEAKDKGKPTRTKYRRNYPQVEAKLFISGDITSLSSDTAKREVVRLMKEHNIAVTDIDHLAPKDYESDDHARLRRYFEIQMGVPKDKWAKLGKGASLTPQKPNILR